MEDSTHQDDARNIRVIDLKAADVRAMIREELERALAARPAPAPSGLIDGRDLCRTLGISPATRLRLDAEGMPHTFAGKRKRYSIVEVQAWLAARGPKPTKVMQAPPRTPAEDPIDVSGVVSRAGMRRAR